MNYRLFALQLVAVVALLPIGAFAQFTIEGVADRTMYNSAVQVRVPAQAGFDYAVTLNGTNFPAGVFVTVSRSDFYELRATRTEQSSGTVSNRYLRFIINDPARVGTETGLPTHTPFPVIQSSSNEFAGARLRVLAPAAFPSGYNVPIVAWVVNDEGHAVRGNGVLKNGATPLFQLRRGVGSGLVTPTNASGTFQLDLNIAGVNTNASVAIEENISWTTVSGTLSGETSWPANSRIHVTGNLTVPNGSTLNVGEGSIVRLNSRVDITNNGVVNLNGTVGNPIVFMPAMNGQPWGGFISKTTSGTIVGTGTIFTGAGAVPNWFGANGNPGSHRVEQALFYLDGGQQLTLTDCAAIYFPGQLGHSRASSPTTFITLTRFLLQRCTTGGEYTGAQFVVNDSAFIEFPDDTANFVDGDNDGLYIVNGSHWFTNTLFGWAKDDGIDSGGSGYGPLTYESCWFEGTFHEGNSTSGYKNVHTRHTVYIDCGQGIESGYDAPSNRVDTCLFTANKVGVRHGDNYTTFSGYGGRVIATNTISIFNHRDLFGFNWDASNNGGWTNSVDRFFATNNWVSRLDTNYADNRLWDPAAEGWRLGAFGGVGHVGVGFATRPGQSTLGVFPDGIPVGLSIFCTNEVRVDYAIDGTDGTHVSGTLVFPQGLTRQHIPVPTSVTGVLRVALSSPVNAEITSEPRLLFQNLSGGAGGNTVMIPAGSVWKYWDQGTDLGTAWRDLNFDDSGWAAGPAELGYGDGGEATVVSFGPNANNKYPTTYFRQKFVVADPAAFTSVIISLLRDDGGVVYLNGQEVFRSNMPQGPITYSTLAANQIPNGDETRYFTNVVAASALVVGTNICAVEIHNGSLSSSDLSFNLQLAATPNAPSRLNLATLGSDAVLYWSDATFSLEEADAVTGPWRWASRTNSPAAAPLEGMRFFRLRK